MDAVDETEAAVHDVCDYIIVRLNEPTAHLSVLKLHKLLYYVQAWHLAFFDKPLFGSRFEAWVHGPVNRIIYDRFRDTKSMYSRVTMRDLQDNFSVEKLSDSQRRHVDSVLEVYAEYADTQLEEMTHRERPWLEARMGYESNQRCQEFISNDNMKSYFAARLN